MTFQFTLPYLIVWAGLVYDSRFSYLRAFLRTRCFYRSVSLGNLLETQLESHLDALVWVAPTTLGIQILNDVLATSMLFAKLHRTGIGRLKPDISSIARLILT